MNQNKLIFSLFLLSSLVLTSCLRDVELNADNFDENDQLVVLAEFEEGKNALIQLSSTFEVNSVPQIIDGNLAEVTITESSTNFGELREFRPFPINPSVLRVPSGLSPIQGETYRLSVKASGMEFEPIFGETTMPLRGSIDNSNVEIITENQSFSELSVSLNLGETPDLSSFYHLIPFVIDNSGNQIFPDISKVVSGENAATVLTHRDGILIDINSLDNTNLLEFHLRSLLPLDINQLSDKNLHFKLNTVAEEYYLYHKSVSSQFETNQSPFTIPTLSYSQFENGYGIFTAYSSEIFDSPIN